MQQKSEEAGLNIEAEVSELERKLDRLRVLYEQYFMGIEKRAPTVLHKEVVRVMRVLDKERIHNTRLRYRYRSLVQRFNTYRTYWNRTMRAIEAGTYHRDLARLRRNWAQRGLQVEMPAAGRMKSVSVGAVERAVKGALAQRAQTAGSKEGSPQEGADRSAAASPRGRAAGRPQPEPDAPEEMAPIDIGDEAPHGPPSAPPPARPLAGKPPAAVPQASSRMCLPPGFTESQMQSIYRRYVKARRLCGEDPGEVGYQDLARSISARVPRLMELNEGRPVDFDVVVRRGQVVLKAKPR